MELGPNPKERPSGHPSTCFFEGALLVASRLGTGKSLTFFLQCKYMYSLDSKLFNNHGFNPGILCQSEICRTPDEEIYFIIYKLQN
jgi:hypothetical protein